MAFQSPQHRLGRLNRTQISGVTSQSVTSCFAHAGRRERRPARARTQTLAFKVHFSKLDLIRPLARLSALLDLPCAAAAAATAAAGPFRPTSSTSPAGLPDYRTTDAAVGSIAKSSAKSSAVYHRGVASTTTDKFLSSSGFSHARGVAAVRARRAPVVCICGDIFKQSQ